jgi:hypothetical protein
VARNKLMYSRAGRPDHRPLRQHQQRQGQPDDDPQGLGPERQDDGVQGPPEEYGPQTLQLLQIEEVADEDLHIPGPEQQVDRGEEGRLDPQSAPDDGGLPGGLGWHVPVEERRQRHGQPAQPDTQPQKQPLGRAGDGVHHLEVGHQTTHQEEQQGSPDRADDGGQPDQERGQRRPGLLPVPRLRPGAVQDLRGLRRDGHPGILPRASPVSSAGYSSVTMPPATMQFGAPSGHVG